MRFDHLFPWEVRSALYGVAWAVATSKTWCIHLFSGRHPQAARPLEASKLKQIESMGWMLDGLPLPVRRQVLCDLSKHGHAVIACPTEESALEIARRIGRESEHVRATFYEPVGKRGKGRLWGESR